MTTTPPQVGILMGSDNDYEIMIEAGPPCTVLASLLK